MSFPKVCIVRNNNDSQIYSIDDIIAKTLIIKIDYKWERCKNKIENRSKRSYTQTIKFFRKPIGRVLFLLFM